MKQRLSDHFGLYVSVSLARALVSELARRGIAQELLFEQMAVSASALEDPRGQIACDDWDALVQRALQLTGDPGLGLRIGYEGPIQMYQLVGWLALSAPNMRQAVTLLRYAQPLLANHVTIQLSERANDAYLYFDQVALDPSSARVGADFGVAALARFGARMGLPQGYLREVWFRHAEPSYASEYTRLFGCTVRYRRPRNALVFDRALLGHANPAGDELMQRLLSQHAESFLSVRPRPALASQIQVILLQEDSLCAVDSSELANRLGTSARALRWQLARDGHSMRRIVDEVRFFIARRALCNDGTSVHELAERLGFSEASAFYRAFKRWTGETPAAFVARSSGAEAAAALTAEPKVVARASRDSGIWRNPLADELELSAHVHAD